MTNVIKGFEDLKKETKELNVYKESSPQRIPWASEVLSRSSNTPRGAISSTLAWWQENDARRKAGLENEIDLNEIKAAGKGTKNIWFKTVQKYPEYFTKYLDGGKNLDWKMVLNLRNSVEGV